MLDSGKLNTKVFTFRGSVGCWKVWWCCWNWEELLELELNGVIGVGAATNDWETVSEWREDEGETIWEWLMRKRGEMLDTH